MCCYDSKRWAYPIRASFHSYHSCSCLVSYCGFLKYCFLLPSLCMVLRCWNMDKSIPTQDSNWCWRGIMLLRAAYSWLVMQLDGDKTSLHILVACAHVSFPSKGGGKLEQLVPGINWCTLLQCVPHLWLVLECVFVRLFWVPNVISVFLMCC